MCPNSGAGRKRGGVHTRSPSGCAREVAVHFAGWSAGWSNRPVPLREVGEQPQARALALLGVKLEGHQVVAGDRAGEGLDVVRCPDAVLRPGRAGVVAVDEIEPGLVGHAVPDWVRTRLLNPVPSHVRDLQTLAVR